MRYLRRGQLGVDRWTCTDSVLRRTVTLRRVRLKGPSRRLDALFVLHRLGALGVTDLFLADEELENATGQLGLVRRLYIAELADGVTLDLAPDVRRAWPVSVRVAALHDVVSVLAVMHSMGEPYGGLDATAVVLHPEQGRAQLSPFAVHMRTDPLFSPCSAPEELFGITPLSSAGDMWAFGCIVVHMLTGRELFRAGTRADQLCAITEKLGCPTRTEWAFLGDHYDDATAAMQEHTFTLDQFLHGLSEDAVDLVIRLLALHPDSRLTAQEARAHPFFQGAAPAAPLSDQQQQQQQQQQKGQGQVHKGVGGGEEGQQQAYPSMAVDTVPSPRWWDTDKLVKPRAMTREDKATRVYTELDAKPPPPSYKKQQQKNEEEPVPVPVQTAQHGASAWEINVEAAKGTMPPVLSSSTKATSKTAKATKKGIAGGKAKAPKVETEEMSLLDQESIDLIHILNEGEGKRIPKPNTKHRQEEQQQHQEEEEEDEKDAAEMDNTALQMELNSVLREVEHAIHHASALHNNSNHHSNMETDVIEDPVIRYHQQRLERYRDHMRAQRASPAKGYTTSSRVLAGSSSSASSSNGYDDEHDDSSSGVEVPFAAVSPLRSSPERSHRSHTLSSSAKKTKKMNKKATKNKSTKSSSRQGPFSPLASPMGAAGTPLQHLRMGNPYSTTMNLTSRSGGGHGKSKNGTNELLIVVESAKGLPTRMATWVFHAGAELISSQRDVPESLAVHLKLDRHRDMGPEVLAKAKTEFAHSMRLTMTKSRLVHVLQHQPLLIELHATRGDGVGAASFVAGTCTVDLSVLARGMAELDGWYGIVDRFGNELGELKVRVVPQRAVKPRADCAAAKRTRYTSPVKKYQIHDDDDHHHHHHMKTKKKRDQSSSYFDDEEDEDSADSLLDFSYEQLEHWRQVRQDLERLNGSVGEQRASSPPLATRGKISPSKPGLDAVAIPAAPRSPVMEVHVALPGLRKQNTEDKSED